MKDPYWYLHLSRATQLQGRDRLIYRAFEVMPGVLSIATLAGFIALSVFLPIWAAYFTIAFSIYWLFKTWYLTVHLRHNYKRLRHNLSVDWDERLKVLKHDHIVHLAIFPYFEEPYEVIAESVQALLSSTYDTKRIAVVLAAEARSSAEKKAYAHRLAEEYGSSFRAFLVTEHPSDIPGEIPGKGSNISYAAEEARKRILDAQRIPYEDVIVSAFDVDTVVYPQYFSCLTWHFLTAENPMRSSFQPIPLYNNNIWHAPMLSRLIGYSSSFWQMVQQERPEKLATFSSHAVPFVPLREVGYWQKNVVSEDSRIYWNLFLRFDGDYTVIPMAYPVSMDANVGTNLWETARNIYRQHRRWTYGAENIAYILFAFLKNPRISLNKKLRASAFQIEGFWSLATHPIILFAIGWLPLVVGGQEFNSTVLSYNLPLIAQGFLTAAMVGLVISAAISLNLLPKRPAAYGRVKHFALLIQWLLVPATMILFSSIPGLDAQMRLLTGRYLGFWVTPKRRGSAGNAAQIPAHT